MSTQYPLLIGLDAGLKPAAVIGQRDCRGRLLILGGCFVGPANSMDMGCFVAAMLPYLQMRPPVVAVP